MQLKIHSIDENNDGSRGRTALLRTRKPNFKYVYDRSFNAYLQISGEQSEEIGTGERDGLSRDIKRTGSVLLDRSEVEKLVKAVIKNDSTGVLHVFELHKLLDEAVKDIQKTQARLRKKRQESDKR